MKNLFKKLTSAVLTMGLLATMATPVFAATEVTDSTNSTTTAATIKNRGGKAPAAGERPERTEEQKIEMQAKIMEDHAQLLADGKITQEQYNEALAELAEGKMPKIGLNGRYMKDRPELSEEQKAEREAKKAEKAQ